MRNATGFSSHFKLPDSDDTAVTLYVLHQVGYKVSIEDLLKFFNGNHFTTFSYEMSSSLSTNINALRTLRLFQANKEVNEVAQKIATFIERINSTKAQVLIDDKWHSSPYYSSSRAVFSLHGLRDNTVNILIDFFIQNQNRDGGWGRDGLSTAEETAYVALALCYGLKHGYDVPKAVLQAASKFLSGMNGECRWDAELWVGKVFYRPALVVESAILAARYALVKSLEFIQLRAILEETKPDYVNVKYKGNQLSLIHI